MLIHHQLDPQLLQRFSLKTQMDDPDLFADTSDDVFSTDGWQVIHPTPKALPLPSNLTKVASPRIRAPFQVADLLSASSSVSRPVLPKASPVQHSSGLPRPLPAESHIGSLQYPNVSHHSEVSLGLPAPEFSQPIPRSFIRTDPENDQSPEPIWQGNPIPGTKSRKQSAPKMPPPVGSAQSRDASHLTRIRIASQSPVVWKLWIQFSEALKDYSDVLTQIYSSAFPDEHAARLLNQFAATTLVRYMTCILQFIQLCRDMQVDLQSLTEATLADLLVCGSLARRADGSGPKCSASIKALRWACKVLGVQAFKFAYGSLISSFEKQKIPADRRESLPFPLYIIMRWERRILQSQASQKEVVILGGLLMLCWSGLRFSDLQRSHLASWQLDQTSLRGLTWRAKTCSTATPFGILLSGLLSQGSWNWAMKFLTTLDSIYTTQDPNQIDYAIPAFHQNSEPVTPFEAMTCAEALYYLRFYMTLPWSQHSAQLQVEASSYSVHSLKATVLSWAAQANLPEEDRRVHGKHKPAQMSVQLYSRDDILGSLRVQSELISRASQGWRPVTPLSRGGQVPLTEPQFTLEKFKKNVEITEWKFFLFNTKSSLQCVADAAQHDVPESEGEESSDSTSSSSASSESSESEARPSAQKSLKTHAPDFRDSAEEAIVGLHRKTWHIMVSTSTPHADLPKWQGVDLKTACGRFLPHTKVHPGFEVDLTSGQALCSHAGCRKGFMCIGLNS